MGGVPPASLNYERAEQTDRDAQPRGGLVNSFTALISETNATIVAAIIHNGPDILMVWEQGPNDNAPRWSLPGGQVEAGESLHEALRREVQEETGLEAQEIGRLVNTCTPIVAGQPYVCAVYEVSAWTGEPAPADPDNLVSDAKFLSPVDAIACIERRPELARKEPVIAYLNGEITIPESWIYELLDDGGQKLLRREVLG
jgi:8-oxo-dGTP diphosphatase